jgi:predicted dienelactone hydrolase
MKMGMWRDGSVGSVGSHAALVLVVLTLPRVAYAVPLGVTERAFRDEARERTIPVAIWYPTTDDAPKGAIRDVPIFSSLDAARDAPVVGENHPIALLSHGSGGTPFDLAWIVPMLVDEGHVVVAVTHPGNNWQDLDDKETLQIWKRPRDVSFALDQVLVDDKIRAHLDPTRVIAIGHSLGGYTVMALGGARYDVARARAHCASKARDPSCDFVPDVDRTTIDYSLSSESLKDPRVTRIVALAPAVGSGIDPRSFADIRVPVLIIAARDDDITTVDAHALRYASALDAPLIMLPAGSHYAFVGPCNLVGKAAALVWLDACREPGERSRVEQHARMTRAIRAFVVEK